MSAAHAILLVHSDRAVLARLASRLATAGYVATTAATFEEARGLLVASPPALLVTAVRLGAYNGLHLIVHSRADYPETAALLISEVHDPVVEAEAAQYGAAYLSSAEQNDRFVRTVTRLLSGSAA